jgi:quercetin dioxygenase-like cupin family protein
MSNLTFQPDRRDFLAMCAWGGPIAASLPVASPQAAQTGPRPGGIQPDEGELVLVGPTRDPVRIKVTVPPPAQGRFAMIVQEMAPSSRVPIHLHEREDEIIYIQRGTGRATVADQTVTLRAGSMLYVPQNTWHGGENTGGETLVWVAIYSPSGFEGYFREIGFGPNGEPPPSLGPEEREARDRRYGIRYR